MDLKTAKYDIIEKLMHLEDQGLLTEIHQLLKYHESDFADSLSDNEKEAIEKGIAQSEVNEGIPNEEMKKKHAKWLTK